MPELTEVIRRGDYQPPDFFIEQTELQFELDPSRTRVTSRVRYRHNPARPGRLLRLDGEQLELLTLRLDGRELTGTEYRRDETSLQIDDPPEQFTLELVTVINPAGNTALEGLYLSNGIFCTQCEAEGFRRITYYPDRPDVLAPFRTTVIADRRACPVLLANGNRISGQDLPDGRHQVVWEDPFPKPSYLFALVAGDLAEIADRFVTVSKREVALRFYVEPHHRDKVAHAMQALKKAMRWDEERFGREYDLDIYMVVAVDDFNMGAMENKGLNIFNSKYVLARPDTATDADFQAIEEVIAHEYFHNWTGNRITCRDWFQLSLKEGLTVFRDQEFSADQVHRDVKRIEDVRLLRNSQFPEDAGPMAHPVRPDQYQTINNFYTMTVYHKGAEVIRMYQTLLGRNGFRAGMDRYFADFDGQAVTCDDFLQAMAAASGRDFSRFALWYSQAGTPFLEMAGDFAAGTYTLKVRQSIPPTPDQPAKQPLHMPLRIALLDGDGKEMPLRMLGEGESALTERVLELRDAEQQFRFIDLKGAPVPSLLRGFSAPVRYSYPYSDDDLRFLLRHDTDPFARWEAGQTLFCRVLLALIEDCRAGRPLQVPPELIRVCAVLLEAGNVEPALRAQLLTLPAESYLADQMEVADPDAIRTVRQATRRAIAVALQPLLAATFSAMTDPPPYRYDPVATGRRELKNLSLAYLMLLEGEAELACCQAQYEGADNMTDALAALRCLADSYAPRREAALRSFFARWRHEPLVVDKWFALQATSSREDVLDQVEQLLSHPAFLSKNPNRVRSLLGSFAHGNQAGFHAVSGRGYRLVAEQVIAFDRTNPQLAARLVSSFNRRRKFDAGRQELMAGELRRIREAGQLSRDVREIVEKNLAEPD